jgi:hypothetical protein
VRICAPGADFCPKTSKTAGFPAAFEKERRKRKKKHMKNEGFLGICSSPWGWKEKRKERKGGCSGNVSPLLICILAEGAGEVVTNL